MRPVRYTPPGEHTAIHAHACIYIYIYIHTLLSCWVTKSVYTRVQVLRRTCSYFRGIRTGETHTHIHTQYAQGGADAASPRYIFTYLNTLTRNIFHESDDAVLKYLSDDGQVFICVCVCIYIYIYICMYVLCMYIYYLYMN
jgi:hypothetical protein